MEASTGAFKVLVCSTGSVASIKLQILVEELVKNQFEVKVITTEKALHFFDKSNVKAEVFEDADEWKTWSKRGDPVLHIELRRWADLMLIAPLDANTLAKLACGICDNLLTSTARAWDLQRPLLFAPAMNTAMWNHPLTAQQIGTLKGFGYKEIPVIEKTLICGDTGAGAMAEVSTIVQAVTEERSKYQTDVR